MAGRKNAPSSLQIHQNISDSEDGPNSEPTSGNRPNGRVYSPDYISPPCYQPPNPLSTQQQSQYQQPYTTRSTPLLVDHQKNHEITDDRSENQEHMEPPYYLQDQIKNRSLSESKQLPEEYRGMPIGGDPPPYRQPPPKAIPVRDNRYRSEYSSDPPGHLALPPTDYRQQYFTQGLNGGNEVNRRFSPLRLPIVGTQWRVCSWRLCALAFLTLSLGLAATTIYLAAFQVADWSSDAHCLPGSTDSRMSHSPSSHRLPNQQRPADSGKKHNSGPFLAPLLFPSMILLQETQEDKFELPELNIDSRHASRESIYNRRTSSVKLRNEIVNKMLDRYFYAYRYVAPLFYSSVTKKPVKILLYPSRVASQSNENNNRHVNESSSLNGTSISNNSLDAVSTAAVRTAATHYTAAYERLKRSVSGATTTTTTFISTVEFAPRETTSPTLMTKDQIINMDEEEKNAILQNNNSNNETSKRADISETTNFMKNLMSQPAINLRSVSKNVEKNLHMSKDGENAFLSTEDINLYANDIVNLETQNKNSSSLLPQTMNKSKNIDESSSDSVKTFVPFEEKSLSILKSTGERDERIKEKKEGNKILDNFRVNNTYNDSVKQSITPLTNFETDSNAYNEIAFSNKILSESHDAVYVTSSQGTFDNDSSTNPTNNVIETSPPSFDRDAIIDLKARLQDESISKKEFEHSNESASVTLKPNQSDSRENFYSKEIPDVPRWSSAGGKISAEREDAARFIISSKLNTSPEPKRMSKLNHAFSDGHFQEEEKVERQEERGDLLFLVNFQEEGAEERRQLQKENYTLKVDSEGRQISNQISEDGVLDSNRKFKETVSAHKMRDLKTSLPEESGLNPINLKSNRSQTNLTWEDNFSSLDFSPSSTVANEREEGIEVSQKKAQQTDVLNDTYNRSLYSEFNGEMTSSVGQNGSYDKSADPIMIDEYDPEGGTQNGKLEKLENGREKTKQINQQYQQQQPPKNQYPPFLPSLQMGEASSTAKAPKIPEEDLKNTEEMFDEYSNSAPRISSKADIESIAFFNASTIYLRSTLPRLIDSESFGDPDHEARSTIRGFMDNTREIEPFYQTKSTAEEGGNLIVEKTFLQSSQRFGTDDDAKDVYSQSFTKFLNLDDVGASIVVTPSSTLSFTLSISPSSEMISTQYLKGEIPFVNSKILGPNSLNLHEDRIEQTNEYKFTSDNRISPLEFEAFTSVPPFASFVGTVTISHTITGTIFPSTSQFAFAKPISTILHSTLATNESNKETAPSAREEVADLVQREEVSLFVNSSLGSPIPPIDITDGFVEGPIMKPTKLVIQSASSLPYDGAHNHEKYSHSRSNSFVKDEIVDLIFNHTPTNHIYNTTSRAENVHNAPGKNKKPQTTINGAEGEKLFNNAENSDFKVNNFQMEENEGNKDENNLIINENSEFKNDFSQIQNNENLESLELVEKLQQLEINLTVPSIYGNHLAIMFSDKNLAPNNINDIKYWNKSSTSLHAESSIEEEKFAATAIVDVDNSTETSENSKQVFDGTDNVGKQSLDQVRKEDAEVFPGSNSGNQELNVNNGLRKKDVINEEMEEQINKGIEADMKMEEGEFEVKKNELKEGTLNTKDGIEASDKISDETKFKDSKFYFNFPDEMDEIDFTDYHSLEEIEEIIDELNEATAEEIKEDGLLNEKRDEDTRDKKINLNIKREDEEIAKEQERKFTLGNLSLTQKEEIEEGAKEEMAIDSLKGGSVLRRTNNINNNNNNNKDEEDLNSVSDVQLAFDQHSGSELETLSRDRNKESRTVTSGMKTTSRGGTQDELPESYVPILQLEKHHLLLPNIYSDQNQQRNESFQRVIGSGNKNLFGSSSHPSTESTEDYLRRAKDGEVTSLQNSLELQQTKEALNEKNLEISFNDSNSHQAYDEHLLQKKEHFMNEVFDKRHLIREKNEEHLFTESIHCPCSCPCNKRPLSKQSNSSVSADETIDADTNKEKEKGGSRDDEGTAEVTPSPMHKENDGGKGDNDNDDYENREPNLENGDLESGELEKHNSNGNKNSNSVSKSQRHRHHHGEKHLMRKQSHSNEQLPPASPSPINMKKHENFPTEMANLSSCNSSLRRQSEERNATGDIDNLAGSSSRKKMSPPDLEKCSRGSKDCSVDRIASLYLNLFGSKKSLSSHFYVVPILYGKEISSHSWHWRTLSDASNELLSSADLEEESLNSTGSSTVRRPHQIAPPDGASFSALILGEALTFLMPPYGYWNLHLTLSDATEMHLALTIPRGTSIGLYARRNSLPTHTQHDLMKVLRGSSPRESRSTSGGIVEVTLEEVLESGDWFLSFYNDDGDPHKVGLLATRGSGSGECPQRCNGRGHCFLGRCQCQTGYSGHDCSEVLCPILCNGRGEYVEGQCQCHPGWKGKECELKHHECEVPDCSGHGHCVDGVCHCATGFTGEFCEKVDCPNPTCSGHGWCVRGTCVCDRGWKRPDCSQMDTEALQCLPDCNKHGTFDINTHSCICNPPWTGSDCSKEACSLDCGPHGKCENEVCQCDEGWTGPRCTERLCDSRCAEHGQCKNGTCVCMTGWNGRHCTLAGCPQNCMGPSNGRCVADNEGQWSCKCNEEWEGIDCAVQIELICSDGNDNDKDGLMDCNDPECCESPECNKMPQCTSLPSPIDILLKMQPPAATASFYEKMQFIVQDNSLQSFQRGSFNKRRAAVIRGRVVTAAGRPIVGLRISSLNDSDGITFTRLDGMFDFMINGGGAVTVRFGKQPLSPREIQVVVPWNEIVVLDDVVMTVERSDSHHSGYRGHSGEYMDKFGMFNDSSAPCPQHDYDLLRPIIMSTWQNEFQGECPAVDAILVETQAVQESVQIPGTGLFLVYHSSRATGYKSTLRFQLTPERIPSSLRRVHLRIVLEGILFKKVFEADPLLKFTYSWDRNNVYKLSVYGTTIARISVGYEHSGCENMIIWDHHTTKVAGYDLAISEMGGFNLHVHHAYNFHQGILQKGDGRNIHLAGQRHLVTTLLGTGEQREVVCGAKCDGEANKNPLLAPTCLAAAPDGSLYVGDFNLIRRVTPEGKVFTVARLNETRVSYRYHVAVSPVTGDVYVSDPDAHQVLKLQKTFDVQDPSRNVIPIVGSGQRCLPGDRNKCGDGGPAIHARLTYPKGLAISAKDEIYIADGTNIRVVSGDVIKTVIGGHDHRSHWAPVPCNGTIERDQLRLRWPTELAISPLDGSLHILDDHLVLRLTPDNRVQVLTGRPLHCPAPSHNPQHMSRAALLLAPQSIAFSLQGDLYIAESDTQRINRVRVITTNGHISTFAGADSKCNCRDRSCFCHTFDNVSATSAVFSLISAIAVTPDGILHISDQAGYRIRSVRSLLPEQNEQGEYEIFSPDTHEVFVFNRFGKHMETRNLITGQTIYKFTYNTNANTGKLSSVTDAAGNSFKVIRRTYAKKTFIENPQKQRVTIHFTIMNNDLEKLEAPDGYNITFRYHSASGLIQSKMEGGGRTYSYEYDDQGRLVRAVLPTGEVIALNFDLSIRGAQVTATRDGENSVTAIIRGNTITHKTDSVQAISEGSGVLRLITAWDHEISMERTSYRVLETKSPTSAQMFPILSKQQTHIGKDLVNTYEWSFSPAEHVNKHDGMKVSADLRVNTVELLSLEYDPVSSSEALRSDTGEILVNITYDKIGRPTRWLPKDPLVPTSVNYDAWGHVILWKRGRLSEEYEYDTFLRLASVTYGDNTTIRYEFKEQLTKPERVTYPSGRSYGLVYDEAGAIQEVVTPKGSTYSLHLSTSLGFYRLRLALPGNTVIMQMRVDEQGRLVTVSHPDEEGILLYEYDLLGRLRNELYGHGLTEYTYLDSGLLKTARTRHTNHDIRIEYRYRTGLAKEMKIKYGSKSNLHDAKFHYQYDESARLRVIEGEIESNAIQEIYLKYDNLTGSLLAVNDLRVIRNNILETTIHNQKKYFVYTRKLDNYGRISEEVIRLQDRTVYLMELKYDLRGRISEQLNEISGRRMFTNYKYMADGQILEATGGHTRLYTYDKNGNVLSFTDENRAEFLHYDESDRVIKAGDGDVEYNSKGYVIRFDKQNFEYNTKGQLVSGYSRDKSWSFSFRYDHLNRVSVYRDHLGNVTQIIYGRPDKPHLISHLHNPLTHSTYTLIYDDRNRLIAMNGPEGQNYIATDQNGAPIAFFDENGGLIRRQRWTPFGRVTDYAGPPMWVGIGPWGGLLEPITGIIVLDGYAYHPRLLQWMTPRWDKLTRATRQVTDVFVYRFRNNDPINPPGQLDYHFNDVSDWLRVMGYELSNVLGSEYQGYMLERPLPTIDVSALANSEVVSGLWCQYRASINHLQDLSFFSRSHIQRHVGEWNGAPISRQSYVFGPGVLVSNVDGFALVTSVPLVKDGSTVIGNVIRAVLNNSLILDVSSTHEGRDTFYFIKDEQKRASEDRETLARLSGIYNVTHMDSNGNLENHVATPTANIVIFYNKKIDKIRNRILTQLELRAEEAAWAREAALVKSGRPGTRPWDPKEVVELTSKGRVSNYLARHVHASSKYPLLAADPSNILFKHESTRKRRKSRRKERKKGWRRRNKFLMSGLDT